MGERIRLYLTETKALDAPQTFERCYQQMSASRREKIDRMRMEQDKKLSLAAGLLLDKGLREYGLRESEVRICKGEYGKPYLADFPDIHFSLSHSNEMAIAVFSGREIGCDIEYRKRTDRKLAKRFFCPEEYAWMMETTDEGERMERFYRIWTLKESYLKMTGWGLRLPLDSFRFSFEQPSGEELDASPKGGSRRLQVSVSLGGEWECEEKSCMVRRLPDSVAVLYTRDDQPYGRFEEYQIGEYSAAICLQIEEKEYERL